MRKIIINKKGVSSVISSVILIVMGMVALGMISGIVLNFVKLNSAKLAPAFTCAEWKSASPITIESACFDEGKKEVRTVVRRGINMGEINAITFNLISDSSARGYRCGERECEECTLLKEGETKEYYIDTLEINIPKKIKLIADGCEIDEKEIRVCN